MHKPGSTVSNFSLIAHETELRRNTRTSDVKWKGHGKRGWTYYSQGQDLSQAQNYPFDIHRTLFCLEDIHKRYNVG